MPRATIMVVDDQSEVGRVARDISRACRIFGQAHLRPRPSTPSPWSSLSLARYGRLRFACRPGILRILSVGCGGRCLGSLSGNGEEKSLSRAIIRPDEGVPGSIWRRDEPR